MTLDGGVACLDFVNSGYDREYDVITERLSSYEDLMILIERLQLFDTNYLDTLKSKARQSPELATEALMFARNIRQKLYCLFSGIAQQNIAEADQGLITYLNELFAEAHRFDVLSVNGKNIEFSFQTAPGDLMAPVWRLLLSAYDLLKGGNLHHLKQCQRCAWLFMDQTKNHRKKWCSMESCGNAQKTKRYYARQKAKI